MKSRSCIFCLLLINSFLCFSQEKEVSIVFLSQEQKTFYDIYFRLNNIVYKEDGMVLKLNADSKLLTDILEIEKLKIDVIRNNIDNNRTTRTASGGPFKRHFVDISLKDGITVKVDTESGHSRKFDPTHPDAILTGKMEGYVLLPNIDLICEYDSLSNAIQLFNNIVEYIQRNNIGIIIDKISPDRPADFLKEYHIELINFYNSRTNGYKSRYLRYEYCDKNNLRSDYMEIDFSQGVLKKTGRELDFMIFGDGFFKIMLKNNKIGYTRNGEFTIDPETNRLMTTDGYLLHEKIFIEPSFKKIVINKDHSIKAIYSNGEERNCGNLPIYILNNSQLDYYNSNIFLYNGDKEEISSAEIDNGFLEESNVEPLQTYVNIIAISRLLNMKFDFNDEQDEWFDEWSAEFINNIFRR